MKKRENSIFNNKVIVASMLLLVVKPAYFGQFPILNFVYAYGCLICAVFLILLVFFTKKFTKELIWITIFYGCFLFTTFIGGNGNVYNYVRAIFPSVAMCLIFSLWIEKDPDTLIDSFAVLETFVYINLFTIIIFPQGLYRTDLYTQCWFLGYKNPQIRTILPVACLSLIRSYRKYGKISIRTWLLLGCSAITFALIDSATSLVGFAIFLGQFALFHKKSKLLPRFLTLTNAVAATIIVFIAIMLWGIQYLFSGLIETTLGRDLTFTNRIVVWGRTWALVSQKPLLGYGYLSVSNYTQMLGSVYYSHPHNFFLNIAMQGGTILIIALMYGFFMASAVLQKTSETIYSKIILFCLISFLVMGLVEALTGTVLLYPMLILAMKSDQLAALGDLKHEDKFKKFGKTIVFKIR